MDTVWSYLDFYKGYAIAEWKAMGPIEYGTLLILIGVSGWFLMKTSGNK